MKTGQLRGLIGLGLLAFATANACSTTDDDDDDYSAAGEGGEANTPGGTNSKGGSAGTAGSGHGGSTAGGAIGGAGHGGDPTGGGGVVGDGGMGGMGGVGHCAISDECGGCDPGQLVVKCSWGEVPPALDVWADNVSLASACDRARRVFAGEGGAGAGGASGALSGGGAANDAGLCGTYVEPETRIKGCSEGCTETEHESKVGQCVINDECCVVARVTGCGV